MMYNYLVAVEENKCNTDKMFSADVIFILF